MADRRRREDAEATPAADRRKTPRRAGPRMPVSLWAVEDDGSGIYYHHASDLSPGGLFLVVFRHAVPAIDIRGEGDEPAPDHGEGVELVRSFPTMVTVSRIVLPSGVRVTRPPVSVTPAMAERSSRPI